MKKKFDIIEEMKKRCELVIAICTILAIVAVPLNFLARMYIKSVIRDGFATYTKHDALGAKMGVKK